ncbi:MAG: Asp-tRNA(Asn)/Glu-tRNA(Gln) amidotransferase subunit GatA [Phycisphaerae bacterium]|nr:Asp-tRNA(Asn)/Glu-tRNA(Gln) amidotransferase subunit GatA [Phycisphaerae bacterium]
MTDALDMTATQLRDAIAAGDVSAGEATRACLDAIERTDGQLACFNEVYADRATQQADRIDQRLAAGESVGALGGVPVAVKDNMCTAYGRTTCASRMLAEFRAPYTATAVTKLEAAGAVILGKTNMDEFAMGSSTEHSAVAPTRNPWDTSRVPGGSSGGSAAAVASRQCPAALGSDTGGSIRQPAALCGVVGFKPTYGRVSRYGLVAFGSSLDQIGPVTRDVRDAALLSAVIAGHDPHDSTSIDRPVPDYAADVHTPVEPLRIGMPREWFTDALDGEIAAALRRAAKTYERHGAELVHVSLPHSRIDVADDGALSSYAVSCYYIVCMAEASSNLARYDGVQYGHRTDQAGGDIVEMLCRSRAEGFGEEVKRRVMLGTYTLSAGYYDAYYNKALKVRRLIARDFQQAFERCDVLLCPATPSVAFELGSKTDDPMAMYLQDIYTNSLNLAGLPGLSLPIALSDSGLPIGMQLIGPALGEQTVLRAARMYETISDAADHKPSVTAS